MQRKTVIASAIAASSMLGTGAFALAVTSGGGGGLNAAASVADGAEPSTSVVVERVFDDTFVVLGTAPAAVAPRREAVTITGRNTAPEPTAPDSSTTAPPNTAPPTTRARTVSSTPTTTHPRQQPSSTVTNPPSTTAEPTTVPAGPTTTVASQSATYTSTGGAFTLQWTPTTMHVTAPHPNTGYAASIEGAGSEIHVVFTSDDRDIEITITLVAGSPRVRGL